MNVTRRMVDKVMFNPPPGWGRLFAYVPRSGKVRCLLCGRAGYGFAPRSEVTFDGYRLTPAPWQARCLVGHYARCETCRRPFVNNTALAGHQNCKLHHACCLEHTTVPEWANPFRRAS